MDAETLTADALTTFVRDVVAGGVTVRRMTVGRREEIASALVAAGDQLEAEDSEVARVVEILRRDLPERDT